MEALVATAQRPTAVSHCVTGKFAGSNTSNLLIAKFTHLELYSFSVEGLDLIVEFPLYDRVAALVAFRPNGASHDSVFLCTESLKCFVYSFDLKTGSPRIVTSASLKQRVGQKADSGILAAVDGTGKFAAVHAYDHLIQVLNLEAKSKLEPTNMQIEEHRVLSLCFVTTKAPTFMILYQDVESQRRMKSYELEMKAGRPLPGSWAPVKLVDVSDKTLIPVPGPVPGVLVIGGSIVAHYHNSGSPAVRSTATYPHPHPPVTWVMLDANRYILGDIEGNLSVVVLRYQDDRVKVIVEPLGRATSARTLGFLEQGLLFVGSTYGDSQLIRLRTEKNEKGSFLDIMEEYANIGPIVDMTVVDLDRHGQAELVTCSGAYNHGSLRVVRSGMKIIPELTFDCPGVLELWSLRGTTHYRYFVLSFLTRTRVFTITSSPDGMEAVEEVRLEGFDHNTRTVHCGWMEFGLVQVTSTEVRLINLVEGKVVSWNAAQTLSKTSSSSCSSSSSFPSAYSCTDAPFPISIATSNGQSILVTCTGHLCHLYVKPHTMDYFCTTISLNFEASCLALSSPSASRPGCVAVGSWQDTSLRIYSLELLEVHCEAIDNVLPRSLCFVEFNSSMIFLLCGLGDGTLITYRFDPSTGKCSNRRQQKLGTVPLGLSILQTPKDSSKTRVFVCCDRPAFIHLGPEGKLTFTNVDAHDVSFLAPFSSELFPDCVVFLSGRTLTIGSVDSLQKLHVRKIPLGEQPRRLAYQKSTKTFALGTFLHRDRSQNDENTPTEVGFVRLLDSKTYERLDSHQLDPFEHIASVVTATFDQKEYYFVGTAYAMADDPEPAEGRILCFRAEEKKMRLLGSNPVKGAVYAMAQFGDNKLVAAVNSRVQLFCWDGSDEDMKETDIAEAKPPLKPLCSSRGNLLALCLQVQGDYVIVGDMMNSVSVLGYSAETNTFAQLAKDHDANWMTAVDVLKDDVYICADDCSNLFTLTRDAQSKDLNRAFLRCTGRFHVGEFVNVFRHGSLTNNLSQEGNDQINATHIFGCISGAIGLIAPLAPKQFQRLTKFSAALQPVTPLGSRFEEWRGFKNLRKELATSGFVDGDFLESFHTLDRGTQQKVAEQAGMDVEAIVTLLENLRRLC